MGNLELRPIDTDSSQNISSMSSQSSSNGIPKLAEKLRILGGDISFEKATVPRRRRNDVSVATKKKMISICDNSIELETTRLDLTYQHINTNILASRFKQ